MEERKKPASFREAGWEWHEPVRGSISGTPEHLFSGADRDDAAITEWVGRRDSPGFPDECHGIRVARKTVEVSTMETGKPFEFVNRAD